VKWDAAEIGTEEYLRVGHIAMESMEITRIRAEITGVTNKEFVANYVKIITAIQVTKICSADVRLSWWVTK
jgi:hypothetical protein